MKRAATSPGGYLQACPLPTHLTAELQVPARPIRAAVGPSRHTRPGMVLRAP